jgi:hypothetical protein
MQVAGKEAARSGQATPEFLRKEQEEIDAILLQKEHKTMLQQVTAYVSIRCIHTYNTQTQSSCRKNTRPCSSRS